MENDSTDDDHPTRKDLKKLRVVVMDEVTEVNNSPQFRQDAKTDAIAVGLNKGQVIKTGNVKTRRETDSDDRTQYTELKTPDGSKKKATHDEYGINMDLSNVILSEVKTSSVYEKSQLDVKVVEEKHNPRDNPTLQAIYDKASDHAAKQAETNMQAYCEQTESELSKVTVSKPPCEGCHEDLSTRGVSVFMVSEIPETKTVKHRTEIEVDGGEVRFRMGRNKKVGVALHIYSGNIPLSKKAFKQTVKSTVNGSVKPGASVGIISGAVQLKDTIENEDFQPFADGGMLNKGTSVTKNFLIGERYYASASVIQGRAGFGELASVGVSAVSAGAHVEYGSNNSVGVDVSVVRVNGNIGPVQASVGLNLDTHASVGLNGVSVSFLGMGFSFGPRVGIQTPFFDFSITLI